MFLTVVLLFSHNISLIPIKAYPLVSSQMGVADIEEFSVRGTPGANVYQQYFFHSHNCISSNFSQYFSPVLAAHRGANVDQH